MNTQKIKFSADMVVQLTAGEVDCLVVDGVIYVPIVSGIAIATPSAKPNAQVADDTRGGVAVAKPAVAKTPVTPPANKPAPVAPPATPARRPAPAKKVEDKPALIEDWATLEVGQNIMVELDVAEFKGKLFSAEVTEMVEEEGEERTYVLFHEDQETDFLREGDKVYEFSTKF